MILMLMLLGLLAMNEVVEGIKEIKKWGKDNEWGISVIGNSNNNGGYFITRSIGGDSMILILAILILVALSTIALIAANKIDEDDLMEELKKELEKQERGDK